MMDIRTVVSLFEIALGAGVLLFLVLIFSSMYRTLGDFLRALTCPEYYALNSIFLRGKRLRYVTDFPNDLRRACLVKDTYYADKPEDKARERKTKLLVRRVLANDTIINEYFREQYFTYKDFLEVKELCDLPEYDETSELMDELASHLKDPKSAVVMKELIIEVMTDDLVEFKAGKREAALLKAMNRSECTKVPWEQKDFVAFMIKLGINSGKFKGVKESTVGTYSTEIQKNMDTELCEYSVHLQKLIDKRIRQFLEKKVEFDTRFYNSKVKHLKIPNIAAVPELGAAFSYGAKKSSVTETVLIFRRKIKTVSQKLYRDGQKKDSNGDGCGECE